MNKKLSILIPVYNEINHIEKCLNDVLKTKIENFDKEIIISDNNSNDGTKEYLSKLKKPNLKILLQNNNRGKGANLINALKHASGDIVIFQDSDMEYPAINYNDLIEPFKKYNADVVYGTRLTGAKMTKILGYPNFIANKIITIIFNILFNKLFTDVETGHKVFSKKLIDSLNLQSNGFEIEIEVSCKISAKKNINIYEVPIIIDSRRYNEGKKVKISDFFVAIYSIFKWRLLLLFNK